MADKTIAQLTAASAAALTDKYEIQDNGGTSLYVTGTQLQTLLLGGAVTVTAAGRALLDDADAAAQLVTLGATPLVAEGRAKTGGTTYYSIPGVVTTGVNTFTLTAAFLHYMPFFVQSSITLDQLACEVTTAAAAGNNLRMGIYAATTDWNATGTPLVDSGAVLVDTTGVKTASISLTLTRGRYLFASLPQANVGLRTVLGSAPFMGYSTTLGASPYISELYASQAYGALPSSPPAWTAGLANVGIAQHVFCRISVP